MSSLLTPLHLLTASPSAHLQARSLETSGDKQKLFDRLREALQAAEDAQPTRETVSHEVVANVLVGAEEAEAKLEALLQRKRELLGEA